MLLLKKRQGKATLRKPENIRSPLTRLRVAEAGQVGSWWGRWTGERALSAGQLLGALPLLASQLLTMVETHPGSPGSSGSLPLYSESVRYLLVRRRYSGSPARSSGAPRATALKSRSRPKRFGSGWLWECGLCMITARELWAPKRGEALSPSQGAP